MSESESGQYAKAICEYMFDGTERKLKSPVDAYFALAKRKLELSRTQFQQSNKRRAVLRFARSAQRAVRRSNDR